MIIIIIIIILIIVVILIVIIRIIIVIIIIIILIIINNSNDNSNDNNKRSCQILVQMDRRIREALRIFFFVDKQSYSSSHVELLLLSVLMFFLKKLSQ